MVQITSRSASVPAGIVGAEGTTGHAEAPGGAPDSATAAGMEQPVRRGSSQERLRQLVHRPDAQDVFPTGLTRLTDSQFSVSAHWPRSHRFFAPVAGRHQDPLLIAETMRQTTMLIAHAEFGVPLGDAFVMWELRYVSEAERLVLGEEPWDITVDVSCSRIQRRGRSLGSMHLELLLHRRGTVLASGGGRISCTSARAYQRVRGDRGAMLGARIPLLPAVAPRTVGRTSEQDVVLAPAAAPGTWALRLDTRHPTLFSHANDHVPGILLLEAARQAAQAASPGRTFLPTSIQADFLQYVELDRPCWIEALPVPADGTSHAGVRIRAVQNDEPAFICTLRTPDLLQAGLSDTRSRRP
ncbi:MULTISPECIES: ScbA/BarX family gamma-butyrolactone biosynthesis protein [unclassified Streptomyces]|uniref:ScbA/BarX family gamma-butyrolactone biosynthesis protein n=1 Tax=unclassified Streptomyces TaxID=2593676 RepID=UPI000F999081|nr:MULTISPECIES: ScbA/BarX family gamma-butyrolactone biosynthesis protein [unclassified Streptomyces]MCX4772932.1 ScbA/BarX family gamma-butyrolactone biosynthesis protein [Streptomyces sp. NBC_01285]ROQ71096.1 A-factor biosynthesis hotdog protein [Streptomyces sp. CEV 2-1]